MKFRVNIGQHCGKNLAGETRLWYQGQICETETNLTKRFGNEKFTRVSDGDRADDGVPFHVDGEIDPNLNKDDYREFTPLTQRERQEEESNLTDDFSKGLNPSVDATLNELGIEELTKLAADEEVDLKGAKTKKQIIERLGQAQRDRAPA